MALYLRICNFCHKEFEAQKVTTKFCSNSCASRGYKVRTRMEHESMFEDKEQIKRMLTRVVCAIEEIEALLQSLNLKQEISKDLLLSADKFCELKKISRKTLDRMMQSKTVEITRIGSRIYIHKNQL
jgi:hypothetical protein